MTENKENENTNGGNGKLGGFIILSCIFGLVLWFCYDWVISIALVGAEFKSGGEDYTEITSFFQSLNGKIIFIVIVSSILSYSLINNVSDTKKDIKRGWQKFKCPSCKASWDKQNVLETGNTGLSWKYQTKDGEADKRRKNNHQVTNFLRYCACSKCGTKYRVVYKLAKKHDIKNKIETIDQVESPQN